MPEERRERDTHRWREREGGWFARGAEKQVQGGPSTTGREHPPFLVEGQLVGQVLHPDPEAPLGHSQLRQLEGGERPL